MVGINLLVRRRRFILPIFPWQAASASGLAGMTDDQTRRLGFKHHAKVQGFRLFTVLFAWGLIAAGLYFRPDVVKQALRASTRAIESIGDAIPSPWGDRIEIMLREIGGFIWLQITALVVTLRFFFWFIAALWRRSRR